MSLVITGATGGFGGAVVDHLLSAGIDPVTVVATGRHEAGLAALAERGVAVRRTDFSDPTSLEDAFSAGDDVLLVSTTLPAERLENHRRAIEAAAAARVRRIVYTSMVNADSAAMVLADAHRRTEELLRRSGVVHTVLRNGWYLENYTRQLAEVSRSGTLLGAAGDGRVSAVTRSDLAAAAASVMRGEDLDALDGAVLELGSEGFTLTELAETMSEIVGRPVTYRDLDEAELVETMVAAGAPRPRAEVMADSDRGLARGELYTESVDLAGLLGRAPLTRRDALAQAWSSVDRPGSAPVGAPYRQATGASS
jgi:NAD(P)H dehydrogenase (quinone)